jgi:hypothetical protein
MSDAKKTAEIEMPAAPAAEPHPLRFAINGVTDKIPDLKSFISAQNFDEDLKTYINSELDELESNAATVHLHEVERPSGGLDLHLSIQPVQLGARPNAVITGKKLSGAVALLFFLLTLGAVAGTLVFPTTTVNGTVNGPTNSISGAFIPNTPFAIISPNITNAPVYVTNVVAGVTNVVNVITNCAGVDWQYSLDGTNFTTLDTYNPSGTNAAVDNFTPNTSQLTVYYRARVRTTNALTFTITR